MTLKQARKIKNELLIAQDLGFLGRDDIRVTAFTKCVRITVPDQAMADRLPATVRNLTVKAKVGKVTKPKTKKK